LSEAAHPLEVTASRASYPPLDLVAQPKAALDANKADFAVAKIGDQPHPVFSLCRTSVLPSLTAFLESGGRKIDLWYSQLKVVEVQFADEAALRNINTREELAANHGS
jgi:molybdopterin-guanine dinucleotide biosynthesis protein A